MQKKILSAVLALCLVGSSSVAFAGYYDIDITKRLNVDDSFKDQSDDDGLDLDIKKSFNGNDNDGYDIDVMNSHNKKYDIDVTKSTEIKVNAQGNGVLGKFVVQQFGGSEGAGAGEGGVYNIDNSINGSKINSHNDTNSHNRTMTSTKTKNYNETINNSYNRTRNSSHTADIDVSVNVDKSQNFKAVNSFNRNRLGGFGPGVQ
jgi:hypothetical protein